MRSITQKKGQRITMLIVPNYAPSNSVKENILYFTKKINSLSKYKMIKARRKKFTKIGNFKG